MELINVEPTRPKWAKLASIHGIECKPANRLLSFAHGETSMESVFTATIEWFGSSEIESGSSPREAVVWLIHRLKLTGWQEVTV